MAFTQLVSGGGACLVLLVSQNAGTRVAELIVLLLTVLVVFLVVLPRVVVVSAS